MIWWAYPSRVVFFILIPVYLGCGMIDADDFQNYGQPDKYLVGESFLLGLFGLVLFALAAMYVEPNAIRPSPYREVNARTLDLALITFYGITLTAYLIFLAPMISHPELLLEHLRGSSSSSYELRETLNHIPGLTTLVTLQSVCLVLHLSYSRLTGKRRPIIFRYCMVALVISCIMRAWLWSERIAVLELLLPAAIIMLSVPPGRHKLVIFLAPFFGIVFMFGLFALGEYFRSWQFYKTTLNSSFFQFALLRFAGYYSTALNNGAGFFQHHETLYIPQMTAAWFYRLPLWESLDIPLTDPLEDFLKPYANPEFNNLSGIFMPFVDYGILGGLICWAFLGLVSGNLFKAFATNKPVGVLLYPVWYIGITDILRIFYWGDQRFFGVLVGSVVLASYFGSSRNSARLLQNAID